MTVESIEDNNIFCTWFFIFGVDIKEYSGPYSNTFKNDQLELA